MPTASDYTLLAEYPKQQVVRDRNYIALNNWAGYTASLPIPQAKPDESWVKIRIVSERIPMQPDSYVQRTMSYFLQDPATQTNVRQYLNAFNDDAVETALAAQMEPIIGSFMPRFADVDVSDAQVTDWYNANGFPSPEVIRAMPGPAPGPSPHMPPIV
jgi:predicted Abi (CAAX) family protease